MLGQAGDRREMADAAEHEYAERGRKATLYVVATPIGNLQDVTLRALDVFKQVDVIAAEDTRVTSRLLNHYGIASRKLIALHEHNEQRTAPHVIELLGAGRSVALASDAGTPAFSDPGARLVAAVRDAGYPVVPIPGPNAAAAALSASGLAGPHFVFYGFLPAKAGERRQALEDLKSSPYMLVFYEAPHRIVETLEALAATLDGSRRIVIARELTKLFETIHVCNLDAAGAWISADAHRQKGEFVLIVDAPAARPDVDSETVRRTLDILLEELPVKQAATLASKITGARKNDLYELALKSKARRDEC
jgi:16S rRNA (cytidine1402-2'-O)-methyltransferase